MPAIQAIRSACPFVGYDNIRRNTASPILSMSAMIRCWAGSATETPTATTSGQSAATLVRLLDASSVESLKQFLKIAHEAWGVDPEFYRLWGTLNLAVCMWMWRRLVIDRDRFGNKRYVVVSAAEFKQCLMSVSADGDYVQWLVGRNLTERDRSPCYARLKSIFVRRLSAGKEKRALLPQPEWSSR